MFLSSVKVTSNKRCLDVWVTACHNTIQRTIPIPRVVEVSDNDTGWREWKVDPFRWRLCHSALNQWQEGQRKRRVPPPRTAPALKTALLLMPLLCHHNHATSVNDEWKICFPSFPLSVIPMIKSYWTFLYYANVPHWKSHYF